MRALFAFFALLIVAADFDETSLAVEKRYMRDSEITVHHRPVFHGTEQNDHVTLRFTVTGSEELLLADKIIIKFKANSSLKSLDSVSVSYTGNAMNQEFCELFAASKNISSKTVLDGEIKVSSGINTFKIGFYARPDADLLGTLGIKSVSIILSDGKRKVFIPPAGAPVLRFSKVVRAAGQDGSDTYRIPGLVTTNAGSIVAVYDIRYGNSKDLQGNIDIGMSRSTDSGQTWEPMKVIMDMGQWGGKPEEQNGVGDPCILVDKFTGTIWVAALWLNGFPDKAAWNASGPGIDPAVTGQFIIVKSEDDGLTWSDEKATSITHSLSAE